ncbi:phage tail tape measure protein, lambda family [Pseudomonas guariconensis]|nr:phage tail tape measure protein, lambda family [Pseudomonas guariconensis]
MYTEAELNQLRDAAREQFKDNPERKGPAYREDAGTKALDQARQQYSVLQQQNGLIGAQVGEMQKLGEAGQALVRWEQQLADIKGKQVLTADQRSLLASQDLITAQLKKNAALEREMQLRKVATEEAQKLSAFQANLNSQLQRASAVLESNLAGMGMGDVSRQRMQERLNIEQQYQQQLDNLEQQHNEGRISQSLYDKETAALRQALSDRLAMQDRYYQDVDDAQRDWTLGAQGAFLTYYENANDFAGQSRQAFTTAFSGMNDALVDFVKTGKLSFSDLTATFAETALRMLIQWGTSQVIMAGLNAFTSTAAIPLVGPLAAPAAAASSMGQAGSFMTMINSVAGMAHDGMDYIPREGTWLLDKGERVVDSRTNSDLKRYLAASNRDSDQRGRGDLNIPIQVSVQGQPGMSEAEARRQGQLAGEGVRDLIMQIIQEQQRPGGMLA